MTQADTPHAHAHDDPHDSHDDHLGHVVPLKLLVGIFAALIVLTILTVAAINVDLGAMNIWVALFIAVIKGGLVALYFMHLRWDNPFNGVVLMVALVMLAVFIGIALKDALTYQPLFNEQLETMASPAPAEAAEPVEP